MAFYYEGDLNDLDCGSVGDQELDTWEDWCDSAFRNGYSGFPPDADDPSISTSVGVIAPGMLPILVIGLLDCVGGPLGCSDWLGRLSWWAWLAGHRRSSSLDAAPVTGSLLYYAPVALLCVVPLKSLRGYCSAVRIVSGLLGVDYFSGKLV